MSSSGRWLYLTIESNSLPADHPTQAKEARVEHAATLWAPFSLQSLLPYWDVGNACD